MQSKCFSHKCHSMRNTFLPQTLASGVSHQGYGTLLGVCFTDCLAHQKVYLRIRPVSDLMLKPPAPSTWPGPHDEELSQYLLSKVIIIQGENCFIHSTIIREWSLPSRSSMSTWECFIAPHSKILEISGWVLVISVSPSPSIILGTPSAS